MPFPLLAAGLSPQGDWDSGNLLANADFSEVTDSGLPKGWAVVCPNPAIAPRFKLENGANGCHVLTAIGDGHKECFGYVSHKVSLAAGKTYRFRVEFRATGLDDINRHLVHGVFGNFNDGIFDYQKRGEELIGDNRFPGPARAEEAEVRLYFRFSPAGKVQWERVSLQECAPIPARKVRIACAWGRHDMEFWSRWLDAAGQRKVDMALLPEMFNGKSPRDPEPPAGPSAALLSEKARQWRMYVTGSYYEIRNNLVNNTARLFNREGKPVGCYSKIEPTEVEGDEGVSPGSELPVFTTDFGRVGIMICYDSWFPEVTRLLAYKGAELVLLPNAGYFPELMPARAADNGVCLAASSLDNPAGIWDSGGIMAGEHNPDRGQRFAPVMISDFEKDDKARIYVATLDLSLRSSPAWGGGPMHSAPGGRRVRQNLIEPIEDDIAREAKRWWTGPNP